MNRFLLALFSCAAAMLLVVSPLAANAQQPTLHLVGDAAYAPFSFNYGGTLKGIDVEVVQELGVRLGIPVRIELMSKGDMIRILESGGCDGLLALRPSEDNRDSMLFLSKYPLHVSTYSAFMRRAGWFAVNTLEDLQGRTVGLREDVDLGAAYQRAVREQRFEPRLYPSESRAIGALIKGEVEVYLGETKATHHLLEKMGMSNTIQAEGKPLFKRGGEYLALLKSSPYPDKEALLKLMELAMSDIFADGTYRRIVHRYVF